MNKIKINVCRTPEREQRKDTFFNYNSHGRCIGIHTTIAVCPGAKLLPLAKKLTEFFVDLRDPDITLYSKTSEYKTLCFLEGDSQKLENMRKVYGLKGPAMMKYTYPYVWDPDKYSFTEHLNNMAKHILEQHPGKIILSKISGLKGIERKEIKVEKCSAI